MANVDLKNLTKKYGDVIAVQNMDLNIPHNEFLVLVGPSGCGKSTTLRMIAGLEEITSGVEQKILIELLLKKCQIIYLTTWKNILIG